MPHGPAMASSLSFTNMSLNGSVYKCLQDLALGYLIVLLIRYSIGDLGCSVYRFDVYLVYVSSGFGTFLGGKLLGETCCHVRFPSWRWFRLEPGQLCLKQHP